MILTALFFTSCDTCKNIACMNGGQCADGSCLCEIGYDGPQCETEWIEKFPGTYSASNDCVSQSAFSVEIVRTSLTSFSLLNLMASSSQVEATLDGSKLFSIPSQVIDGMVIEGNGEYSNTIITISYTIIINPGEPVEQINVCTALLSN